MLQLSAAIFVHRMYYLNCVFLLCTGERGCPLSSVCPKSLIPSWRKDLLDSPQQSAFFSDQFIESETQVQSLCSSHSQNASSLTPAGIPFALHRAVCNFWVFKDAYLARTAIHLHRIANGAEILDLQISL